VRDIDAGNKDAARIRCERTGNDADESGFTRSIRADQADKLTGRD